MNRMTRVFLVLLRLAIGWHFLFEGIEKLDSMWKGPTETSKPFTSEPYLRGANGPIADLIHGQIGDVDQAALDRLTLQPAAPDQDPGRTPAHTRLSPTLVKEWDAYLVRFATHYQLNDAQRREAEAKLAQSKEQAARWLLIGTKEVDRPLTNTTAHIKKTTPERIQEYQDKLRQIREMMEQKLTAFQRDVEKDKLRSLKAEAAKLRNELLADLNGPMRENLQSILTAEQKQAGPVPDVLATSIWEWSRLQWIDTFTAYGLTGIGLCLIFGLFTRTACVAGAVFLLTLYLAMPPFPWLPEPTRVEGHYYYVNKNLIEMLALFTLATTRSGCWVGLDGLVRFLNPWRWRGGTSER